MARKRKAATRRKRRKSRSSSTSNWIWLGTGLGIGLIIGVALYFYKSVPEQTDNIPIAASPSARPEQKHEVQTAPQQTPPKTTPAARHPRFDFYTLLPEIEVEITEQELEEALRVLPKIDRSGTYILQVGSFRNYEDADALKARLALLGIEANIEAVVNKSGNTWHRVRVGPFTDIKLMKRARRKLKNNHLDFVMLKIKT